MQAVYAFPGQLVSPVSSRTKLQNCSTGILPKVQRGGPWAGQSWALSAAQVFFHTVQDGLSKSSLQQRHGPRSVFSLLTVQRKATLFPLLELLWAF